MVPTPFMDYQSMVIHLGSPDIKTIADIKASSNIVTEVPKAEGVSFITDIARSIKKACDVADGDLFLLICRMPQGGCMYLHGTGGDDSIHFPEKEIGVRDFVVEVAKRKFPDFDYDSVDFTAGPGFGRTLFRAKK